MTLFWIFDRGIDERLQFWPDAGGDHEQVVLWRHPQVRACCSAPAVLADPVARVLLGGGEAHVKAQAEAEALHPERPDADRDALFGELVRRHQRHRLL